jgi:hypothetical protein
VLKQQFARIGEHHTAPRALQQGDVQIDLQLPNLPAQGRLHGAQDQSGLAEAADLSHAHKGFELLEVHRLCIVTAPRRATESSDDFRRLDKQRDRVYSDITLITTESCGKSDITAGGESTLRSDNGVIRARRNELPQRVVDPDTLSG